VANERFATVDPDDVAALADVAAITARSSAQPRMI
jgi:hypothetical protein